MIFKRLLVCMKSFIDVWHSLTNEALLLSNKYHVGETVKTLYLDKYLFIINKLTIKKLKKPINKSKHSKQEKIEL